MMEVKSNITKYKIKDITEIVTKGTSPSTYGYSFEDNGINFFKVESLFKINKIKERNISKISVECHNRLNRSKIKENDILFSIAGTLGRMTIIPKSYLPANTNQALAIIRLNKDQNVNYVYWALQSPEINKIINTIATTGAQPNLSLKQVGNLDVFLPLPEEQQKIAEILSTVDEQIEQTDQLIEKTKELKKGLLQQLLTKGIGHTKFKQSEVGEIPVSWNLSTIENLTTKIIGGGTPSRKINEFYNGDIPWFTVKDMKGKFYQNNSQEYITKEAIIHSSANIIKKNKVVIATRMALGRGFINTKEIAINQDLKALYLDESKIKNEFFLHWYLSKEEDIKLLGSGSTVKGIRLELLRKIVLPIPFIKEQERIIDILSSLNADIEGYQQEKLKFEELKKGLMQQLLTGKTRVKVD